MIHPATALARVTLNFNGVDVFNEATKVPKNQGSTRPQTVVTGKGLDWLLKLVKSKTPA